MKIGILTLPFDNNYGGYLQCLAIIEKLKTLGHDPSIINRKKNIPALFSLKFLKSYINYNFLGKKNRFYNSHTYEECEMRRGRAMIESVNGLLCPLSAPIYSYKDYAKLKPEDYEAILVGSDQVWRPIYVPDVREMFLNFAQTWNIKRIAFAASYGTDNPEFDTTLYNECSRLLSKFDAISVREQSTLELAKSMASRTTIEPVHVLDPVFLLEPEFYLKLFNVSKEPKKRLFCYLLDPNEKKLADAEKMANSFSLQLEMLDANHATELPSISYWIDCIFNSEMVLTDSFHGTAFSIIFNTPFYTYVNEKRGNARIADLLEVFKLNKLMVNEYDFDKYEVACIDWVAVNNKIVEECNRSTEFLINSLAH